MKSKILAVALSTTLLMGVTSNVSALHGHLLDQALWCEQASPFIVNPAKDPMPTLGMTQTEIRKRWGYGTQGCKYKLSLLVSWRSSQNKANSAPSAQPRPTNNRPKISNADRRKAQQMKQVCKFIQIGVQRSPDKSLRSELNALKGKYCS